MDAENSTGKIDSGKKLQLKKYFVAVTLLLVIAIILGQSYQDFHRKQEHLDSKRSHIHHQQSELTKEFMNKLLLLRHYDNINPVLRDTTTLSLRHYFKKIVVSQGVLEKAFENRKLADDDAFLAGQETALVPYINDLLLIANDILSAIEADTATSGIIERQYQNFLSVYTQYQDESERFIDNLSDYLEEESYEHRMVLWGVVYGIITLVIVIGFVFYRFVSKMVNREFTLLEEENELRKESEQETKLHAKLMLEQQMKCALY